MKKKAIGIGIGIAAVVGILIIGFTNIDTIFSRNISETLSEVEISNPLTSLDYKINTKCRLYEALILGFIPDDYNSIEDLREQQLQNWQKTERDKELQMQRAQQIQQKYNDLRYDYAKEHGLQWYDEPGRAPGPEDMTFGHETLILEILENYEANPDLLKRLPLETWAQKPYVLTAFDRAEDPKCVKQLEQTKLSSDFRFE